MGSAYTGPPTDEAVADALAAAAKALRKGGASAAVVDASIEASPGDDVDFMITIEIRGLPSAFEELLR